MFQLGFILVQTGHHHSMSLEKGVIRHCVSPSAFAVHCHFDVKFYLHSTTYFPPPRSHTTHSVGSTGLALWVYAVCGVWGGWVGSFRVGLRHSLRVCYNFRYTRRVEHFAVSCDVSFSYIWMSIAVSCGETFRCIL